MVSNSRTAVLFALALAGATAAHAQSETVTYMHTDGIGSVRMLTNESAQVVARFDYLPFGEPCTTACGTSSSTATARQFAGLEKDTETGLNYVAARYYGINIGGRSTSVDPARIDPLRLVNPQRLNAYALNNPIRFVDADGFDAIVVNFSTQAQRAGVTFGHNGIISVHRDGRATFADLNPAGGSGFGNRRGQSTLSQCLELRSDPMDDQHRPRSEPWPLL